MMKNFKEIVIYQSKNGQIDFRGDFEHDTVWANLNQIAELFGVKKAAISKHLRNIFKSSELDRDSTVSILETVQKEGKRNIKRSIEFYNLDAILAVGYRVNSKEATHFRRWASDILKQYLIDGYSLNKKRIKNNYEQFLQAVDYVKKLLPQGESNLDSAELLDLVSLFAETWFSLDAYDRDTLPINGATKKKISFTSYELSNSLSSLKLELISKKQATELFAKEKTKDSLESIIGNIFQSFDKKELYETIEEKAAHLLYFIIKNHPFVDGNKRSAAFSFIWFLNKAKVLSNGITPEALTAITLLIAESNPKDKEKMVGLVLLLLRGGKNFK